MAVGNGRIGPTKGRADTYEKTQQVPQKLQSLHGKQFQQKKLEDELTADYVKVRGEVEGFQQKMVEIKEGIEKANRKHEENTRGVSKIASNG